ncbi:MAG TPA: VOC family protein [Candidatus Babeliales bacterium]|jgi:catechol 2,3-dioxygenase-like lactoylglutathione lyase family enzyme|nr:VOC family protein [Candidatus Babeliales bacterium]
MSSKISHFSLLVRNQDEALAFYTEKLGFEITEAHKADDNTWYWLTIAPTKDSPISLSLLLPQEQADHAIIGKQSGSIPFFVLSVDDCHATIAHFAAKGVTIIKQPTNEFWGIDALIKDLYGNIIDVCQQTENN